MEALNNLDIYIDHVIEHDDDVIDVVLTINIPYGSIIRCFDRSDIEKLKKVLEGGVYSDNGSGLNIELNNNNLVTLWSEVVMLSLNLLSHMVV